MSFILRFIHKIVDDALAFVKLCQNREVGWMTVDRTTGDFKREQQPLLKKLKLLILFNPTLEWIDRTRLLRLWLHERSVFSGWRERRKQSRSQIQSFVNFFKIDMAQFDPSDVSQYASFEDFFIRKHAPGSRPVFAAGDHTTAVVVADSRVVVYPSVEETKALWIKGKHFTISKLVEDKDLSTPFNNGAIASFRLSPQDYHRFHSPVTGTVKWYKSIPGAYYGVDPLCLRSDVDILTENARCCICVETEDFGEVLFVAIGAEDVGTVVIRDQAKQQGNTVRKGDEIGLFEFGGSSIIVAFEEERIDFDEDLLKFSHR